MRIRRLVEQIDEQHREAMRTIEDDLGQVHLGSHGRSIAESRRRFVRNLGIGGVATFGAAAVPAVALASAASAQSSGGSASEVEIPANDLIILEFAVGLELAAQSAYTVAADSTLLTPQVVEMVRTFGRHHHEHAVTLATLAGRDEETVGLPNNAIVGELAPRITAGQTENAILAVLFEVEEGAAATYAEALGALESPGAAGPAGSILPVESQHATAIGSLLDLPVTDWMPPFQTTDGAFDPATYAG